MKSLQIFKRARYRRFVYLVFVMFGTTLNLLPRRAVFLGLVIAEVVRVPLRERMYQAYFPYATSHLADEPGFRFSTALSRRFYFACVHVLHRVGAYREVVDVVRRETLPRDETSVRYALVRSLFELGEFEAARDAASGATNDELCSMTDLAYHKAMVDMICGDEQSALDAMFWACRSSLHFFRPHQNIAARGSMLYRPNSFDVLCGSEGRLFDLCNFTGQRVTHVGRGELGIRLFERALEAQQRLRKSPPPLSAELTQLFERLDVSFDELRLVPEEWATQIGHLGMLDILFRMRDLGWWSGRALIVVRSNLVANRTFFRLFEGLADVVVIGETVSHAVGEELLSLQRWYGMNFNVFRLPNGEVVPWQEAGALAIMQWETEGRGHVLRDAYDRIFGATPQVQDVFRRMRKAWGMKPDDWYVCLHTRDASHYAEVDGTGQTHRNSPIETYLDAIRAVTDKGGWVIKLGGPNSPRLPSLDRTIDYALSDFRSELMDICLIRNARAFIGTTSGLTNVAISFGVPSALVNCITTDPQLWNRDVRFALKPVRLADGTMLTQAQLTTAPWRWRLFDAGVLDRNGAHPQNNTADEIRAVAEEVVDLASGRHVNGGSQRLLARWQEQLPTPHYYGTSRISAYYLSKYEAALL